MSVGQRKAFYRQRIPESSCTRKGTVDRDILVTSRNGDRKIMQSIRIRGRSPSTKRNRSSHQRCSMKKGVLRNFRKFTGKHLCQSVFIKKETLAQVFCCEFCEISRNTFFREHLWWLLLKEVEPMEPVQMNIYQSNTYRKDLSWLHSKDEPRAQER